MHTNSRLIFARHAQSLFKPGMRVLEIGPDAFPSTFHKMVEASLNQPGSLTWDTIDLYQSPNLTYTTTSEYQFPIADALYDVVFSSQVVEHVRKPWVWMKELARVCKPGGLVITINPVSWPFHEYPIDCWRIYPDGMRAVYDEAGIEVITSLFETSELPGARRRIPGRAPECQPRLIRYWNRLIGLFGFPVECAYDTITIGKKR